MTARLLFILAAMFIAGCGASTNILPEPFTRERADGKIPVKTELIRAQVRAELSGIPEGEAEVARWQAIEADYHSCRLSSKKAAAAAEEVFADCMANRGYVYMFPLDAEQLHNDIAFEMEKNPEKWQNQIVTATVATSPITITNAPPNAIPSDSDSGGYATYLLGIAAIGGIAAVAAGGGGGGDESNSSNNSAPTPNPFPTMTTTPPTMTMMMTITPTPPTGYDINAPELGAWDIRDMDGSFRFLVSRIPIGGWTLRTGFRGINHNSPIFRSVTLMRQDVTRFDIASNHRLEILAVATVNQHGWYFDHYKGNSNQCIERIGNDIRPSECFLAAGEGQVIFDTRPDITRLDQLCGAPWLDSYLNINFPEVNCPPINRLSYSPDMQQVVHAVMADGFNQGVDIGESGFAFSGRYDGNNRAAGFTYDFGGYAFRTDYTRLPSKQDSAVWLDTYRFGALTPINDEVRFFAGVDNYNNAIFAIDAKSDRMHRLGFAIGDGYAVQYEYHINL